MDEVMKGVLVVLLCCATAAAGVVIGDGRREISTAKQCERVGAFVAGDKVFACSPKEAK